MLAVTRAASVMFQGSPVSRDMPYQIICLALPLLVIKPGMRLVPSGQFVGEAPVVAGIIRRWLAAARDVVVDVGGDTGRVLWRHDRGAYPRTKEQLVSACSALRLVDCFEHTIWHRYPGCRCQRL